MILLTVRPQQNQKNKQSEPDREQNTRQGSNLRTNTGHVVRLRRIREYLSPNSSSVVLEGIKTVELETPNSYVTAGSDVDVYQAMDVCLTLHTAAGPVSIGTRLGLLAAQDPSDELEEFGKPEICANPKFTTELKRLVKELVQKAKVRNFPVEHLDELERICTRFDLWRDELGNDLPARVPPMKIRLKEGAIPYKGKARKYPPEVRMKYGRFQQDLGWIYENPNSRWACPALPVRKPGGGFRQTADYKPFNIQVEGIASVMSNPQVDLEMFFGLFDFIKGYWQITEDETCQKLHFYMTHRKIYKPRRIPQSCCDDALFFQATIENCLKELMYKQLLVWIDDLLLFAVVVETYLKKLERLFELLVKLSVTKSSLYELQVKWCGKKTTGKGVSHDPERIKALTSIPYPVNAGELQQFIFAANWMRESVVDFARTVQPLQEPLNTALATATRRTKRVASGIGPEVSDEARVAFDQLKDKLTNSVSLVFPQSDAVMCLITDASGAGYGIIVTQVSTWKAGKPVTEQQHELLVCSKRNRNVIEKEAYPIICSCDQLSHLLLRPQEFRSFCDHRNLIYVFAPDKEVKKHIC
ncbi:Hypothetical protein PHPALM_8873 [Phytophthora palmivora]|uniref:Reverse transcriptase/retrotransposon-derived protein RNase H-like domain-containing protein n=1 Tax=Phytophthora palmivora TaxID=4796 RepID=A0A2P4Y8R5_9STRA|nr:Hypothetical protein PHPALM_8873 [Phytophthora palmivora]